MSAGTMEITPEQSETEQAVLIPLSKLVSNATQTRASLREGAIDDYAERIRNNLPFEPALVFRNGEELYPRPIHHL